MIDTKRILIIRPSALGDVCRTVPILVSLKRRYPEAEIDWLVQDTFAPAIDQHPDLHEAVLFPRNEVAIKNLWRNKERSRLLGLLGRLRRAQYDIVLDCQGLSRSGFFAWCTRSRQRYGYRNARELGWLGVNQRVDIPMAMHTVDRMLELVRAAGAEPMKDLRLYTSAADRALIDTHLKGTNFAVLAPTSRWPGKRWPDDRFAQLAQRMLAENIVEHIAIVGAASERDQCPCVLELADQEERIIDLVGATSIGVLMATIETSKIVIANDSAALHMAVGFGRPLVGLFGPTRIDLVGPYGRKDDVLQAQSPDEYNRHKDKAWGSQAMTKITVDEVLQATLTRLQNSATPSASCG